MAVDAGARQDGELDASASRDEAGTGIVLGLLLAGRWATEVASELGPELERQLAERNPSVRWRLEVVSERLVPPPRDVREAIDAVRLRMLDSGWDLGVLVTDLPLEMQDRPVLGEVISPTHGVGVISLPTLGPRQVRGRLLDAVADVVGDLVGEHPRERDSSAGGRRLARRRRRTRLRLAELAAEPRDPAARRPLFVLRVALDHARLLRTMVWANRPWRLALGLYHALIGSLAFVAIALITRDVWRLASEVGIVRLALLTAVSVAAMTVAIIGAHDLWERSPKRASRRLTVLFNWTTLLTVGLGVVALYLTLLVTTALGSLLIIPGRAMAEAAGRPEHVSDYLNLAWLITSLATFGGALGSGLESDAAIRHAIYSARALRSD